MQIPMPSIPKVVIVTRTRDRKVLLVRAIQSVLNQSFSDWQHVIVNDGGDKDTLETLCREFEKAYKGRLKVIHLDHVGMQAASNEAIKSSKSVYVTIHDDDDEWHPDFLEEAVSQLESLGPDSPYQGVISKTVRIIEEEQPDGSFKELNREPYVPLDLISLSRIGYENPFPPIAFLYRRAVHKELGYFEQKWNLVADLDFNFRFLQRFEISVINKTLAHYYWRTDSSQSNNANTVTAAKGDHARLLNELTNHYLRQTGSTEEFVRGLQFLISSFAVENQWMTGEIRERTIQLEQAFAHFGEQLQDLRKFADQTTWPKLVAIEETLQSLHQQKSLIGELMTFKDESLWPKLITVEEKIIALRGELDRLLSGQSAFSEQSAGIESAVNKLTEAVERIESTCSHLAIKGDQIESNLADSHKQIESSISGSQKQLNEQTLQNSAILEELTALRKEVRTIQEESRRQWKIGRFRLQWTSKEPEDAKDQPAK
jgi:glycosyltransferase involved in cell wall biosynthesis